MKLVDKPLTGVNKVCVKCKLPRDTSLYHRHPKTKDRLQSVCNSCKNVEAKENYWKNPQKYRDYANGRHDIAKVNARKRRDLSPQRYLHITAKFRAKKKEVIFDIKPEDIIVPNVCPVLGLKLVFSETGRSEDNSPTVDRLIPSLGYVKDNIEVISKRANRIKGDATLQELKDITKWVESKLLLKETK